MQFTDIAKTSLKLLGKEDLIWYKQISPSAEQYAEGMNLQVIDFVKIATNTILNEISNLYLPLKAKQTITTEDGKISLATFSKNIKEVLKITDKNGNILDFEIYPNYIATKPGEVEVLYTYKHQSDLNFGNITEDFGGRLTETAIAFGVVREFYNINGQYEDAEMWNRKFMEEIEKAMTTRKERKLKCRRWN